jgi:hypothetical protein
MQIGVLQFGVWWYKQDQDQTTLTNKQIYVVFSLLIQSLRTRFQHRRQPHEAAQNDHRPENAAQVAEHSHPEEQVGSETGAKKNPRSESGGPDQFFLVRVKQ